jgi:hypothetical protein
MFDFNISFGDFSNFDTVALEKELAALASIATTAVINSPAVVDSPKNTAPTTAAVQTVVNQVVKAVAPVVAPSVPAKVISKLEPIVTEAVVQNPEVKSSPVGAVISDKATNQIATTISNTFKTDAQKDAELAAAIKTAVPQPGTTATTTAKPNAVNLPFDTTKPATSATMPFDTTKPATTVNLSTTTATTAANVQTAQKFTGDGTKARPLLADGKAFTGTRNGIEYKDGLPVSATRADILQADREANMAKEAEARAASNPMFDFNTRPTAKPADDNYIYYYSWIGGVNTGEWKQYRAPNTPENQAKYGSRSIGGATQADPNSAVGANTLVNQPVVTPPSSQTITSTPTVTATPVVTSAPTVSTSGLTQADVDASVAKALAAQQAKFDALAAQQKAEADAAKLATKIKAKDKLTNLLASYGLTELAGFIDRRIMADVSEEQVMLELYDQPEYQRRFPGMAALRKAGRTITEAEYIRNENAMIQTARFFDLPKGFYDGPEDFGDLIGKQVSPKEYQDRLQVGQDLARSLNPAVKSQLIEFYGVGEGDLTAFVLDADRALPLIQKQAKAAQFVGIGRAAGFTLGGITAQQAENIAGTESYAKLSEAELSKALGTAGQLRSTQQRLSRIEGVEYNEQEALKAVIEGSPEALLASQQRAQREAARFSARGGVTGSSLRSTTTAI